MLNSGNTHIKMIKSSKLIWYWLLGGIFILGVIGSIFSKPSEATPNNQSVSTKPISEVKSSSQQKAEYQIVKRVVDGDTVELEDGEKVRTQKLGLWADNACVEPKVELESKPKDQTQAIIPETNPQEQVEPVTPETTLKPSTTGVIKKSVNDICHAPGTTYYDRTKNFTPYDTIEECLASGGRLPLR